MIINKKVKSLIPISDLNSCYVVADFDRTITSSSSITSWGVLSNSDLVPKEYKEDREKLYGKYRPIEIDESIDFDEKSLLMKKWYEEHLDMLINYKISEEVFDKVSSDSENMQLRSGMKEFLNFLNDNNIPLIIMSAGISNFIEHFLKINGCLLNNIHIISNKIIFREGITSGIDGNIIHSLNKNEISLPQEIINNLINKNKVLLLGDQISDLNMVNKNSDKQVINIGFYSSEVGNNLTLFKNAFDIVFEDNDEFNSILNILFDSRNK